jgi:hypothetical protein
MSPLDDFIDELRAAPHSAETLEMIEAFFHRLQHADDPAAIRIYDDVVEIVRRKSPLPERVIAIIKLLSGWLRNENW